MFHLLLGINSRLLHLFDPRNTEKICSSSLYSLVEEDDGIIVRSAEGKTLGSFNYIPIHPIDQPRIGNFALAGNKLVIGVDDHVVIYELAETLVTPGNLVTN